MILDANRYRINIKAIHELTVDKTPQEIYEFIGILAIVTGVPIIVVCHYIGELYGYNTRLYGFIERLQLFYRVTAVYGVSENAENKLLQTTPQ